MDNAQTVRRIDTGRELLVLGIVRRQALSAYAIDRAVRNHTTLYRGLGQGNMYDFAARMARNGYFASRRDKAKRGPSKSKVVYSLTGKGEKRFHDVLLSIMHDTEASASAIEIGLVLLGQLRRGEAIRIVANRAKALEAQEKRLKRLFGESEGRSGPAQLASSHAVYRLRGEQRFVRDMLRLMEGSRWHPEWS